MHLYENQILPVIISIILLRTTVELILSNLNLNHLKNIQKNPPEQLKSLIDVNAFQNSIVYSMVKIKFNKVEMIYETFIVVLVLITGFLPASFNIFLRIFPETPLFMALYVFLIASVVHFFKLPFDWYWQFKIEEKFGFNTTTYKLWILDSIKVLLISLILTLIVLGLTFYIYNRFSSNWFLYAFGLILIFQIILTVLAPRIIMPLFNKFSPLPDNGLKEKLFALCRDTNFPVSSIEVMDGSKRSKHSNAYFTGFGKFRKIILFDTLIEQLSEDELLAVVAHEIGHYKKRHILKNLLLSAFSTAIGLMILDYLTKSKWFYTAFGLNTQNPAPVFLILFLIGGSITFWILPLFNWLSRKWEYQADAFAAQICGFKEFLISALKKLTEKNLSNLCPHPLYSAIYYSHPNLIERIEAIEKQCKKSIK